MLIIKQHSNITHPKLLTLPYGVNLDSTFEKKAVWDSLNLVLKSNNKSFLVFEGDNFPESSKTHTYWYIGTYIFIDDILEELC